MDGELKLVLVLGGICTGLILVFGHTVIEEEKRWNKFKEEHGCEIVSKVEGEVFNTIGISTSGNTVIGTGFTEDKIGWYCNDGITYYREQ